MTPEPNDLPGVSSERTAPPLALRHEAPTAQTRRFHWGEKRHLHIYSNTDLVGRLSESQDVWRLDYEAGWINNPRGWDLSPALPRSAGSFTDGSTLRPVQWFFDNLLPEEGMRSAIAKDAKIDQADAFGLLAHLGRESAGSLLLLGEGERPDEPEQSRPLSLQELSARIRNMPKVAIATTGPKRMSIAGAQQKLLVGWDGSTLTEPVGSTPSTHILKPDSTSDGYPHSVINEYAMMRLARELDLDVPRVWRIYCPEPAYIVERYDRAVAGGRHVRLHQIDTCQLLNLSRTFKYSQASMQALQQAVEQTRNRTQTRLHLWRWLVFNVLIGNHDSHLKNISYLVDDQGVRIAPSYDLLCTAVYHTPGYDLPPAWPQVDLAVPMPGSPRFANITKEGMLQAAEIIGVPPSAASRELQRTCSAAGPKLDGIMKNIEDENAAMQLEAAVHHGGEMRLLRAIRHVIVRDMVDRLQ